MDLSYTREEEAFRARARRWIDENKPRGEGRHDYESLRAWQRRLHAAGYLGAAWPREWGGAGLSDIEQAILNEELARARAPAPLGSMGISWVGPAILRFGSDAQKRRFVPRLLAGDDIWATGYSEPNAGSDMYNTQTRAVREGDAYLINGQKIWTSLAHISDWIFVVTRTEEGSKGPKGLSFLMMPIDQPGIEIRGIKQINGDAEFNETFFTDARCPEDSMIGAVGEGWKIAMGLLAFERGVSTLGQQMAFRNELDEIIAAARANGAARDPLIRQRIAKAEIGLRLMRYGALRMLSNTDHSKIDGAALTYKIQWATWRRGLGELAMDVLGQAGEVAAGDEYEWDTLPNLFLYSRADTIYGGTNQIQRNLIA